MLNRKTKKCKQCGLPFVQQYGSLQICCSIKCARAFNTDKEVKKRLQQFKIESQKLSDLEKIARIWFQKWVRLRDSHQPCISCGKTSAAQWDGGHYFKAEIFSGLIFEPTNCHKQCSYCNDHLEGNLLEYRKGIERRYGLKYLVTLEEKQYKNRTYKYTREELTSITAEYKLKIKNNEY